MDARRWWWRLSSIVVLLSGPATDAAAANGQDWGPWGMHMMWGSWGIGMMLMMVLWWSAGERVRRTLLCGSRSSRERRQSIMHV